MTAKPMDPEVSAIAAICSTLAELEGDEARMRVLEFATAKFGLQLSGSEHTAARKNQSDGRETRQDEELLGAFEHSKPSENVYLLTALHYSKFGIQPFTVSSLREQAEAAGLIVPARIDKTLLAARSKGKVMYQQIDSGKFRVTVGGEAYLRDVYKVRKGSTPSAPE